ITQQLQTEGKTIIAGEEAFELSDTFGFPLDLTALIAREKGFEIDQEGYEKALAAQKQRSRMDAAKEATDWIEVRDAEATDFIGYDNFESISQILKFRKVKTKTGFEYHIVLDRTPFYAEMGGQVGDQGTLLLQGGTGHGEIVRIVDTKKENDLFIHIVQDPVNEQFLAEADTVLAQIDQDRRAKIARNHSATHLMLAAMRSILGNHVTQKGSYLDDKVLRFDFSHFSKVSPEELERIEDLVNEKIRLDIILDEKRNVPIQEALQAGATATFGEKYGDYVRVITFEPGFSTELCGGTHVTSTGQIGLFKFLSEGSVSAGIRRVEAVAGESALSYIRQQEQTLAALKELLRHPKDLIKQTQSLLEERTTLAKKVEALQNEKIQLLKKQLIERAEDNKSFKLIVSKVDVPNADGLKKLSYDLKDEIPNLIAVLGAEIEGKPFLSVYIAEDLVKEAGLHAGQIVKELAKEIRGGGGGQPFFATAGGSDPSGLDRAL